MYILMAYTVKTNTWETFTKYDGSKWLFPSVEEAQEHYRSTHAYSYSPIVWKRVNGYWEIESYDSGNRLVSKVRICLDV